MSAIENNLEEKLNDYNLFWVDLSDVPNIPNIVRKSLKSDFFSA